MSESPLRFSIIIPTYQRPRQLTEGLRALAELDYTAEKLEVIVVDDGSTEPCWDIVETFANRIPVRLITQPRGGPGLARNTGAAEARGRYLVFTDDDCKLAPDYLRRVDAQLSSRPNVGIGGRTENILDGNVFAEATQQLIDHLYAHFNASPAAPRFFTTTNLVVPRDYFRELKGFDPSFPLAGAEDRDFCERWVGAGFQFVYLPEAIAYHSHALDLRAFVRQHFTYGRGRYFLLRARMRRGGHLSPYESGRFYLNLLRRPIREGVRLHSARLMLLIALTQFSYAMGYARERMRRYHEPLGPKITGRPRVSDAKEALVEL